MSGGKKKSSVGSGSSRKSVSKKGVGKKRNSSDIGNFPLVEGKKAPLKGSIAAFERRERKSSAEEGGILPEE